MKNIFTLIKHTKLKFLLCGLIVLISCDKDDDTTNPDSTNTLIANAGPDQNLTELEQVLLDGSNSEDSENAPFDYLWSFSSKPDGSLATLENANTVSPSFTPDLNGIYEIQLKISNTKFESTDIVKITVAAPATTTVELNGVIREDMTLANIFDEPGVADYCVTGNVDLEAVMTIEPGVEIHFAPDTEFQVSGSEAALIAKGTAEEHIVFTAKDNSEPWRGLAFILADDFRNALDYVDISYAGVDLIGIVDRKASLGLSSFSKLSITNTTITNSLATGMFVEESVELSAFGNNTFSNNVERPLVLPADQVRMLDAQSSFSVGNGDNSIEIHEGDIDIDEDATWIALADETAYYVTDNVNIDDKLTINGGVELRFKVDKSVIVGDGAIIAVGTVDNPVVFTANDNTEPWRGIAILSDNIQNKLEYATISYAGVDKISILSQKAALGISSFDKLSVSNTTISNSASAGMLIDEFADATGFENNVFENNAGTPLIVSIKSLHQLDSESSFGSSNGNDYVEVTGGVVDEDFEINWSGFTDNTPFYILGDISIRGAGIVIAPKTKFRIASNKSIRVDGDETYLSAEGGDDSGRIIFTAFDESLPWKGISILTDDVRNKLDFVEVSFAGSDQLGNISEVANIGIGSFDKATITNTNVLNGSGYGIVVNDPAEVNADIETGNSFSNNALGDVFYEQ